jgi:hypothetical protein
MKKKELIPYIKLEEGEVEYKLKSIKDIKDKYCELFPKAKTMEEFIEKYSIDKNEINNSNNPKSENLISFTEKIYDKYKGKVFQASYQDLIESKFPVAPVSSIDCFQSNMTAAYFELFGIEKISWEKLEGIYYTAFRFESSYNAERSHKKYFFDYEKFPKTDARMDEKKLARPINLLVLIENNFRNTITKYMVNNYSRINKNKNNIAKLRKEFEKIKDYDGETSVYRNKLPVV